MGVFKESVNLSTLCVASAQWERRPALLNPTSESLGRRDSGISDCSTNSISDSAFNAGIPMASKNYKGGDFYTAQILVPIQLPDNKNFLPTFHSCLISRTYALGMHLSSQAAGLSGPLSLKVPVQVCADGSDTGNENARRRSVEASLMREANQMFTPRSIAPPPIQEDPNGVMDELPPEYVAFAPSAGRYQTRVSVAS